MCLAVPMRVVAIDGDTARVETDGVARDVSLALVPDAELGDHVIVHAGYALERLDEEAAAETLRLFRGVSSVIVRLH